MYREKYMQVKPPPPSQLDSKSLSIWATWSTLSEKEVAREAVMKGTHIELAKLFLSRKLDIEDINKWFKNEIDAWILDLLLRKQIYRVMHIFNNMAADPYTEMLTIFIDTSCKELRQIVGNHLTKHEKLDEFQIRNWHLLGAIENHLDILMKLNEKYISVNLKCISKESDEWRSNIGTELFFRTFDFHLKTLVNAKTAWSCLLRTNIDLLKYWINLYYSKNIPQTAINVPNLDIENIDQLNEVFLNLEIDEEMISQVTDEEYSVGKELQAEILNEFARFGIFNKCDRNNLLLVIGMLLKSDKINNIKEVLTGRMSNLSIREFNKLLIDYCEKNNLLSILNVCYPDFIKLDHRGSNSRTIEIISNNYDLPKNINNKQLLRNNIFDTAIFLSKNNLVDYFSSYPLILLSIIFFTEGITIEDLLLNRTSLKIKDFEINRETLLFCLKDYHHFVHFCNKFSNMNDIPSVNHYELLEKHAGIQVGSIFRYKFEKTGLPNFNSPELIQKYGYKKEIDFTYFLKNCRPLYAYNFFKLHYLSKELDEMDYMNCLEKIYKLAFQNFRCKGITVSCIAFLELLQKKSYSLRLQLKCANIIFNSGKIGEAEIQELFSDISANCEEIYFLLETCIIENMSLDVNSSGTDLVEALKSYSIVMRFCASYKLQLPELFLKFCAERDLWLPFLIYVQIYNYPVDIICKLVQSFASKSLLEHIGHAISHEVQLEEVKNPLMRERDSRTSLLSRLGMRLTDSSGGSSDMSSHSSYGSMANSVNSDFLESDTLDYQTNLLEVLIKCHNSVDPPKALLFASRYYKSSLLAVLANSYEPDSVIMNWVTWLEVSCDIKQSFVNFDSVVTADAVLEMFRYILRKNYFKTLTNSFCIFLPENPVCTFMEFLNETTRFNFDATLQDLLQSFNKKITYWRSNSYISEIDHDMSYFNNKLWIQNTAISLLSMTLQYGFRCFYDQIMFLRFLNEIDISQYFLIDFPDIRTFLKIAEYIYEKRYEVTFDLSVISSKTKYFNAINAYINDLTKRGLYEEALDLAKIANVPGDFIIFEQLESQFEDTQSRDGGFWEKWDQIFEKHDIAPDTIVEIYLKFIQRVKDKNEIFTILKLAFSWTNKYKLEDNYDVEKELWLSYFQLDDNSGKLDQLISKDVFTSLPEYSKRLEIIPECYNVLNEVEMENFEKVIEYTLNNEDIITALRLERIFGCTSTDLDILKLCLNLVEGAVLPYQLTARQRLLLNRRNNVKGSANIRRKTYITPNRISSCASVASMTSSTLQLCLNDNVVAPSHDTLELLEMLGDNLKSGNSLASKIFKTYRISVNLQTKYKTILECKQPIDMLRKALEENCRNKLEVVSDFIDIFRLRKEEIADLLYTEIATAIAQYSVSKMNICFLWDLNLDLDFNLLLQLLPDNCSLLGFKLYYGCNNEYTTGNMITVTEMLIRCHDCFTADCNMEGISMVLKKCKSFASVLEGMQDYNLMVRLLTGIARYTEMTYIFHTLKQQEQFELLLRKGSRKDGGLKIALLEYLRKYCPDDVELYKIVALHFFLFSEIAELWEEEAVKYTRRIIALAKLEMQNYRLNPDTEPYVLLVNTEDNKKVLRKIMAKYSHAAEYHLHGQKLSKAMAAAKRAQLVALQLSLHKDLSQGATAICILNLSGVQINKLILSDFNFQQVLILIEAYNFEADWANILFEQYLVKDRSDFFQSFALSFPISESLVHDISRIYLNNRKTIASISRNMGVILNNLNSLHAKYRIASELGFTEIVEELLNSQQLAYLKDTVWKSGYKDVDD